MDESGATTSIKSREQLEAWLRQQPGEEGRRIAVLLAARSALRVLPLVVDAAPPRGGQTRLRSFVALTGASFRSAALALYAVQYPSHLNELIDSALSAAVSANDAAINVLTYSARGAALAASDTASAISFTLSAVSGRAARTARAVVRAAAAVYQDDRYEDFDEDVDTIWDALNADIYALFTRRVNAVGDAPLWLSGAPDWAVASWSKLRAALPPDENWQVWLDWYEERLAGRTRGEAHELVFASVPLAEWDKGPAAANAWIKQHLPKQPEFPQALASVPSAYTFGWNASRRIAIVAGAQNATAFPFAPNAGDHAATLDAARSLIERLLADLKAGRINCARPDYREALERYVGDLPTMAGSGNLILADAEARILRDLFAAEADILSDPFAARLRTILQQHIALRAFYPEVERLYDAVRSGHLERPLPDDAVAAVGRTIKENTPRYFEPEVSEGLKRVEREPPEVALSPDDIAGHGSAPIQPPPDPLGELEPRKSRSFSTASAINALWKTFLKGKDIPEALEGWRDVAGKLGENVGPVIDWLKDFLSKGGS